MYIHTYFLHIYMHFLSYILFPAECHGDDTDFIRLEDCEPVSEPIYDFIPNRNGCQVKRMVRRDREMCHSREFGSQAVV